eukprot:scaffold5070_cov604-Chaetoceros_neogracile.AAC.1
MTKDSSNIFSTSPFVSGNIYAADYAAPTPAILTTAVQDMQTAYNDAANRPNPNFLNYSFGLLNGQLLRPGLYRWVSDVSVTNKITFNGSPTDVWILQITGKLSVATNTEIILTGGADPENIFWQIAKAITVGTESHVEGTFIGATSMAFHTGSSLKGCALLMTAVTLDTATIMTSNISTEPSTGPT